MAAVTANYSLPYQELGDSPDGAQGLQDLAEAVDATLDGNLTLGANLTVPGNLTVSGSIIASDYIHSVNFAGTTDGSGFLTVTHGAGFTPAGGWAIATNSASAFTQVWGIDSIGATTVRLRWCLITANTSANSTAVTGRLFVVRS